MTLSLITHLNFLSILLAAVGDACNMSLRRDAVRTRKGNIINF
jgi:hypothetical protein